MKIAVNEKYELLLEYVKSNDRACPMPWNELWEMLPDRRRVGGGWEPALPLILGAWWNSSPMEKQLRLLEHIRWARDHGVLDQVDAFLRGLSEKQWFHYSDD